MLDSASGALLPLATGRDPDEDARRRYSGAGRGNRGGRYHHQVPLAEGSLFGAARGTGDADAGGRDAYGSRRQLPGSALWRCLRDGVWPAVRGFARGPFAGGFRRAVRAGGGHELRPGVGARGIADGQSGDRERTAGGGPGGGGVRDRGGSRGLEGSLHPWGALVSVCLTASKIC